MKKIFFLTALVIWISPIIGFADIQKGKIPGASDLGIAQDSPIQNVSEGVSALARVVGWVYTIFFILTVLFVVLAAYKYLTKGGEPEKIKEVHQQLIYAAIAVIIALLAVGFSAIVNSFITSIPSAGSAPATDNRVLVPVSPYPSPNPYQD